MKFFHTTWAHAADSIEAAGFRDGEGTYGTSNVYAGVWVADKVLGINEHGGDVDTILVLEIPEAELVEFEWVEDGKPYREFLVPAELLNRHGIERRLSFEDWWAEE